MALSAARMTIAMDPDRIQPKQISFKMKGSTTIYQGSLVAIAAGYVIPGAVDTGLIAVGRALETKTNSGSDGAASILVEAGTFKWVNDSNDAVAQAHVGGPCYIYDDQTVSSDSSGTSIAGTVVKLDSDGVWVQTGLGIIGL